MKKDTLKIGQEEHAAVERLLIELGTGAKLDGRYMMYQFALSPEECAKLARVLRRTDAVWRARYLLLWNLLMEKSRMALHMLPHEKLKQFSALAALADEEAQA